jgi:response regulator of citrate/malate metabolism
MKKRAAKKDPNKYPKGLNAAKVRRIIDHYDHQTDEESAREIETARVVKATSWIEVPIELLPKVRKLLAQYRKTA